MASWQEGLLERGIGLDPALGDRALGSMPPLADQLRHGKAFLRIVDGGAKQGLKVLGSELLSEELPPRDAARDGYGEDPSLGHRLMPFRTHIVDRQLGRCPPAGVEPVKLAGF